MTALLTNDLLTITDTSAQTAVRQANIALETGDPDTVKLRRYHAEMHRLYCYLFPLCRDDTNWSFYYECVVEKLEEIMEEVSERILTLERGQLAQPPMQEIGSVVHTGGRGKPKFEMDVGKVHYLRLIGHTWAEISSMSGVAQTTIFNSLRRAVVDGLYHDPQEFTNISSDDLLMSVQQIREQHPNYGSIMVWGALESWGIHVQRKRVREACRILNPQAQFAVATRPTRRVYYVPCANYLWHIDGTHKLIAYKIVIHAGIDGKSRLIVFNKASSNNRAATVLQAFSEAVEKYGLPLHVRSDLGGENMDVYRHMLAARGPNRGAH
ncbi:hypothetical protein HDU76_008946 [Blyttiomyces sp. JEL0837]|nr:hypothetical protein HDU76_008946 [Blyttiomyces sp. JEL0837]